jgi:hypothetical protein
MKVFVFTVDQQQSRQGPDHVPAMMEALSDLPTLSGFERTAGDEFQGVLNDPLAVCSATHRLVRDARWNIGIGVDTVEDPLPTDPRAGRGKAFLAARAAVTAAKSSPWNLKVVGADHYACRQFETVLWLWAAALARRTAKGWELADLVEQGLNYEQAAQAIGITQSAVSQRAQAASLVEDRRARELIVQHVSQLLKGATS